MEDLSIYDELKPLKAGNVYFTLEDSRKAGKGLIYSDIVLRDPATKRELYRMPQKRQLEPGGEVLNVSGDELLKALSNYQRR